MFGEDALRRLPMAMLVVVGGRDRLLDSYGTQRRVEQAVSHATVRLLADVGHLVPAQTLPILDFLRTPEGARSHA